MLVEEFLKLPCQGALQTEKLPHLLSLVAKEVGLGGLLGLMCVTNDDEGNEVTALRPEIASLMLDHVAAEIRLQTVTKNVGCGVLTLDGEAVAAFTFAPNELVESGMRVHLLPNARLPLRLAFIDADHKASASSASSEIDSKSEEMRTPLHQAFGWPDELAVRDGALVIHPVIGCVLISQWGDQDSGSSFELSRRADGSLMARASYINEPGVLDANSDDRVAVAMSAVDDIIQRPRVVTILESCCEGERTSWSLIRNASGIRLATGPWEDAPVLATGASAQASFRSKCEEALTKLLYSKIDSSLDVSIPPDHFW
jgi:hypothetical protein